MTFGVDDELAIAQLKALAGVPGALKIITNEHACGVDKEPKTAADEATCSTFDYPKTDPRHFVIHDVVAIDEREHVGKVRARSAEGDWTEGRPGAVLNRLQQWRT